MPSRYAKAVSVPRRGGYRRVNSVLLHDAHEDEHELEHQDEDDGELEEVAARNRRLRSGFSMSDCPTATRSGQSHANGLVGAIEWPARIGGIRSSYSLHDFVTGPRSDGRLS